MSNYIIFLIHLLILSTTLWTANAAKRHCLINPYITTINDLDIKDVGNYKSELTFELINNYQKVYKLQNVTYDSSSKSFDTTGAKFKLISEKGCDGSNNYCWSKAGNTSFTYNDYKRRRNHYFDILDQYGSKYDFATVYYPCRTLPTLNHGYHIQGPNSNFAIRCRQTTCCTLKNQRINRIGESDLVLSDRPNLISGYFKFPFLFEFGADGWISYNVYEKPEDLPTYDAPIKHSKIGGHMPFTPLPYRSNENAFITEPKCADAIKSYSMKVVSSEILDSKIRFPITTLTRDNPANSKDLAYAYFDDTDGVKVVYKSEGAKRILADLSSIIDPETSNEKFHLQAASILYGSGGTKSDIVQADVVAYNQKGATFHVSWHLESKPKVYKTEAFLRPDDVFHWRRCNKIVFIYGHTYDMLDFDSTGANHWTSTARPHKLDLGLMVPIEAAHAEGDTVYLVYGKYHVLKAEIAQQNCSRAPEEGLKLEVVSMTETLMSLDFIKGSQNLKEDTFVEVESAEENSYLWLYLLIGVSLVTAFIIVGVLLYLKQNTQDDGIVLSVGSGAKLGSNQSTSRSVLSDTFKPKIIVARKSERIKSPTRSPRSPKSPKSAKSPSWTKTAAKSPLAKLKSPGSPMGLSQEARSK